MKIITDYNKCPGLVKLTLLGATAALLLSSCTSTRSTLDSYQGTPPDNNGIVHTSIHERNFQIWLSNQSDVKGIAAFNSTGPCPDAMGHGQ